jgi:polyisoprenyl-teichoic acid--peptidoglycan teichoic acid transferase
MKINLKPSTRHIVLAVGALALFFGIFFGVKSLVSTWCVTPLPGSPVKVCSGAVGASTLDPAAQQTQTASGATPEPSPTADSAAPAMELPPIWDGASRVTILLMGLDTDTRVDEQGNISADRVGPARSDTMILLTLDPQNKTAGMLSIPRDLWVSIPGFNYGRINTAYYEGQAYKVPGGGPALAMKTVEQVIGVPVQYYAEIEFWAFMSLIEHVGKLNVFVDKKITLDPIGPGEDKIVMPAGWRKMGGMEALAYVRNRHTENGDVDRSVRQQKVIMAFRNKVLDPANFPTMIAAAPKIYADLQAGIHTNLSFEDGMKLAMLMRDIPVEKIQQTVINNTMITFGNVTVNGQNQQVLKPIPDKIRELRDQVFASGLLNSPLATGADALALAKQEGATVLVLNGTYTQGIANKTADYLKSQGINVVNVGNANEIPPVTKIIDHRGRPYALKYFKELFRLNAGAQIISKFDPTAAAEIEIIVGEDWAASNPMP